MGEGEGTKEMFISSDDEGLTLWILRFLLCGFLTENFLIENLRFLTDTFGAVFGCGCGRELPERSREELVDVSLKSNLRLLGAGGGDE